MDVNDERIPDELFAAFLDTMPQVSVEAVLEHDESVLLVRRTNEPAKGEWFWPGGRLYKGERLVDAARRVAREELGVEVAVDERVGVYSHLWDATSVAGADSRHTVNVVYRVHERDPGADIVLDDQHDDYRFVTAPADDCHEYVQRYFAELDL